MQKQTPFAAKVCISTQEYPPRIGGVATAANRLVRNLASENFLVHVVTPCNTPGERGEVLHSEEDGAVVHRLFHDFNNPEAAFAFRRLVRELDEEIDFDLFHGFFLTAVYPCIAVADARSRRRPVIASIRGNDALTLIDHPYTRGSILAALRKADWVTSVSETYLERVAREVNLTGRCSVIRNSVAASVEAFEPWRLNERNRGVVGTVGQLRRVKDIPLMIRGYAGVRASLRRELLLAGYFDDREEEAWSETLAGEFGITDQIKITGRFVQKDVFDHLRAMHVYVQSSAYEGLPNALLEAARLGTPLVATSVGGLREVLVDGENALLVPHGEPARLSQAIERVLEDDILAQHLSIGARRLAEELSPEREWSEWLGLYRRLLESV